MAQTTDSQRVVERFFKALERIIEDKMIRGRKTFTDKYNINRRRLYSIEENKESDAFQVAWLTYLVEDFGISAKWLLTGKGDMYVTYKAPFKSPRQLAREEKLRKTT